MALRGEAQPTFGGLTLIDDSRAIFKLQLRSGVGTIGDLDKPSNTTKDTLGEACCSIKLNLVLDLKAPLLAVIP